jgi:methenyltetrahydrofolate cyclohydrolase
LAMVCNLTLGRPRYADVEQDVQKILDAALDGQRRLLELADADMTAYEAVRDAYRLPRATDDEKTARSAAIERSMTRATEVPVDTAEAARALVDLSLQAAKITNTNALGDVAVAVQLAAAAVRGASEQASLNLTSLSTADFVDGTRKRLATAADRMDAVIADTMESVRARAAG